MLHDDLLSIRLESKCRAALRMQKFMITSIAMIVSSVSVLTAYTVMMVRMIGRSSNEPPEPTACEVRVAHA
jgi:hypothetical protein